MTYGSVKGRGYRFNNNKVLLSKNWLETELKVTLGPVDMLTDKSHILHILLHEYKTNQYQNLHLQDLKGCSEECKADVRCCTFEWSSRERMCNLHRSQSDLKTKTWASPLAGIVNRNHPQADGYFPVSLLAPNMVPTNPVCSKIWYIFRSTMPPSPI